MVGVVKGTCTLYTALLEYHTVAFKIDYTEKYLDPNVVTVVLSPFNPDAGRTARVLGS